MKELVTTDVGRHSVGQAAICKLIRTRCEELKISEAELVRRAGYQNISKGLRRLQELRSGDLQRTASLLTGLADALGVSSDVVN